MKHYGLLLAAAVAIGACQAPRQRQPQDQTRADPRLGTMEMVDIAVVKPGVTGSDARALSSTIRSSARKILIDQKNYAVPKDVYVDEAARVGNATGTGSIAREAGSDAGLLIILEEWETQDLIPRGRVYASGSAKLVESGGTRVLWERSFKDWTRLAPANVTASNRGEMNEGMLRAMVREILSGMPAKSRR